MIIPQTVKIAGVIYTIELIQGLRADHDCSGRIIPTQGKIQLDRDMCVGITNATLLHEVFEIIKMENQLKMSHRALQTMATQFYQVVVDNPDLFKCA